MRTYMVAAGNMQTLWPISVIGVSEMHVVFSQHTFFLYYSSYTKNCICQEQDSQTDCLLAMVLIIIIILFMLSSS